jgi:hypothetical protein
MLTCCYLRTKTTRLIEIKVKHRTERTTNNKQQTTSNEQQNEQINYEISFIQDKGQVNTN